MFAQRMRSVPPWFSGCNAQRVGTFTVPKTFQPVEKGAAGRGAVPPSELIRLVERGHGIRAGWDRAPEERSQPLRSGTGAAPSPVSLHLSFWLTFRAHPISATGARNRARLAEPLGLSLRINPGPVLVHQTFDPITSEPGSLQVSLLVHLRFWCTQQQRGRKQMLQNSLPPCGRDRDCVGAARARMT